MARLNSWIRAVCCLLFFLFATSAFGSEADIKIPPLDGVRVGGLSGMAILYAGLLVCLVGVVFGWRIYVQTRNLPVHPRMANVSNIIWETCKTYLFTQGKFLAILWALIAPCMVYYFGFLTEHKDASGQSMAA